MRFKFIISILAIAAFSITSLAQKKNFDIEVSLTKQMIQRNAESVPVKVKITNQSKDELNTSELKKVFFFISRCSNQENCYDSFHTVVGVEIPARILKETDTFEFEANLADLYWQSVKSGFIDYQFPKNLGKVPKNFNYFFAVIRILDETSEKPSSITFSSNKIALE